MNDSYKYKRPVRPPYYRALRRYLGLTTFLVLAILGIAAFVIAGLRDKPAAPAVSPPENSEIRTTFQTYKTAYFKFQDTIATGKWVLDQRSSTAHEFIYTDFRGQVQEHQLKIYVNQDPLPLYLEVSRTLPVRLVNGNGFEVTGVSDPCVNQYSKSELHRVKTVSISGASMLCDPDTSQYNVIVSQIGGDYHLRLRRANGTTTQFIIVYTDLDLDHQPTNLLNVVGSFQAL